MDLFHNDLEKVCSKTAQNLREITRAQSKRYGKYFGDPYEMEFVALTYHNFLTMELGNEYTTLNLGLEWFWEKKRNGEKKTDHPDLTYWNKEGTFDVVEVKAIYYLGQKVRLYSSDVQRINVDHGKLIDMRKTNEINSKHLVVAYLGSEEIDLTDFHKRVADSIHKDSDKVKLVTC